MLLERSDSPVLRTTVSPISQIVHLAYNKMFQQILDDLINRKHVKTQELYPRRIYEKRTMGRGQNCRKYHHFWEKGKEELTKKPKEWSEK